HDRQAIVDVGIGHDRCDAVTHRHAFHVQHPAHARFFQIGHVFGVVDVAHRVHVTPAHADRHAGQLFGFSAHQSVFFLLGVAAFLAADFFTGFSLRGGRASGLLATAAGCSGRAVVEGSILARNWPVYESGYAATSSGVPVTRIMPPRWPPSGPRSITQSAVLITSRLCSITTTVLPSSRSLCNTPSSASMSWKC